MKIPWNTIFFVFSQTKKKSVGYKFGDMKIKLNKKMFIKNKFNCILNKSKQLHVLLAVYENAVEPPFFILKIRKDYKYKYQIFLLAN